MRVLAWCPDPLDGTAYWRVASPLTRLRQQSTDFDVTIVAKADTNDILAHDLLLLQRPFLDEHVAAMEVARALGRKVWCDWDDDILDVPANNGRMMIYQAERHKNNVRALAAGADVITVTCEQLAKRFRTAAGGTGSKVLIVPNALDPTLSAGEPDADQLPGARQIAWRGGDSHNEDLDMLGGAFPRVARDLDGLAVWHFVGMTPWKILGAFPPQSLFVHGWIGDVVSYLRFMARLRPSVLAVPLARNAFNEKKSNIAVIEAAWMGAVPVAPRWLEGCDLPGVFTYDNDLAKDGEAPTFEQALRAAAAVPQKELSKRLRDLRAAIDEQYALDKINMLRLFAMKRALSGPGKEAA